MDCGVVLLGMLLLAAASQKSPASPVAVSTDSSREFQEVLFSSAQVVASQELISLERELKEEDEEDEATFFLSNTEVISAVPTTIETPENTEIIAEKHVSCSSAAGAFCFQAEALPWLEAVRACARRGGRLATPHAPEEAHALARLLRDAAARVSGARLRGAMHVGVSDLASGHWTTLDGKSPAAAGYDAWLGNRSNADRPSCAALLHNGLYIRHRCEGSLPFACEMPTEEEGYVELPSFGKYHLHVEPLPWLDALQTCKREGATLAVPATPLEAGFMAGALIFHSKNSSIRSNGFFIGINDFAHEGAWQTVAGVPSNDYYNSWSIENSREGEGNCAVLKESGKYGVHPCFEPLAFCCKKTRFLSNTETDAGYETIQGVGKYRLHTKSVSWLEAALQCYKENATLAVPHSPEIASVLSNWIKEELKVPDPWFHVGLHDIDGDGEFESLSERPEYETTYNWWQGYPRYNGDLCVGTASEVFFNYPCSQRIGYFCEKLLY